MHHIYHTKALILSSKEKGEANKVITLFTKELGLIRAVATGIRLNKSKLRFSLQEFSYVDVDLVKGKEVWRITTGKIVDSFPVLISKSHLFVLVSKVSRLLERFCGTEEKHDEIFEEFVKSLYLLDSQVLNNQQEEALELFLVFKIMKKLGYVEEKESLSFLKDGSFDVGFSEKILENKKNIILNINKALVESQL